MNVRRHIQSTITLAAGALLLAVSTLNTATAQVYYSDPTSSGIHYQDWNNMAGQGTYQTANGSYYTGQYTRQPGYHTGSGSYQSANGTSANGNYTYQNANNYLVGGGYASSDGSRANGSFVRQDGYHGGNAQYRSSSGNSYSGNYNYRDQNQFTVGGGYQTSDGHGYGGQVTRNGSQTVVGGTYTQPGVIPGTQERYHAQADINGRDSNLNGQVEIYDATGNVRLANGTGHLDRRGYRQNSNAGIGGVNNGTSADVRFGGVNSTLSQSRSFNYGNYGHLSHGSTVNRHGASTQGNASIAGNNFGYQASIGKNGVRAKVNTPKVDWNKVNNQIQSSIMKSQNLIRKSQARKQSQIAQAKREQAQRTARRKAEQYAQLRKQQIQHAQKITRAAQQRAEALRHQAARAGRNTENAIRNAGRRTENTLRSAGGKASSTFKGAVRGASNFGSGW